MKKIVALILSLMILVSCTTAFAASSVVAPSRPAAKVIGTDNANLGIVATGELIASLIEAINTASDEELASLFNEDTEAVIVAALGNDVVINDVVEVKVAGEYTADMGAQVVTFTLETPYGEGETVVLAFLLFDEVPYNYAQYAVVATGNANGTVTATIDAAVLEAIQGAATTCMIVLTAK